MRQNLVYQSGSSNKFWNVELKGPLITTSWGRMGTKGSSKSERSSSAAAAEKKVAALVKGKLAKGYSLAARKRAASSAAKTTRQPTPAQSSSVARKGASSAAPKKALPRARRAGAKSRAPRKGNPSALTPSYVEWVRIQEAAPQPTGFRPRQRWQVGPELERTVEPGSRRSKKLPGYPSRLIIYPPERLSKMQKLFVRALIPLADLKAPVDHSHLLCFGHDTERTSICWDRSATKPNGEMLICFIDGDDGDRRTDAGYDLPRILRAYRPSDLER